LIEGTVTTEVLSSRNRREREREKKRKRERKKKRKRERKRRRTELEIASHYETENEPYLLGIKLAPGVNSLTYGPHFMPIHSQLMEL
jgi:hypothetical protein